MTSRYNEIYQHLSELLAAHADSGRPIAPTTRLVDDLGLDSMQVMEMLMELEDRLDTSIPLNFLPEVQTMDDLVKALEQQVG